MAAVRLTFKLDEEIVRLTHEKECLLHDLQDHLSFRRRATLQQWLAAVQAHLVVLQAIVDRQWNAADLSVTHIQ